MSVERLNEIKQQLSTLTADEKLDLAAYLTQQARKDKEAELAASSTSNGQQEEPDPYRRREVEWMKQYAKEYAGQYVALLGDRLIAHADSFAEVQQLVQQAGVKHAVITRIAGPGEILFGGW
jgi:hypothetical protein